MPPVEPHPRHSPLHAEHEALGASFVDFAGWSMPVRFDSDLAEHRAVRERAGLFDLSHMAQLRLTGPDAVAAVERVVVADVRSLAVGRAKYSLVLDAEGGILDDVIVYRLGDDEVLVIANAANRDTVLDAVVERTADTGASLDPLADQALIAVQGPESQAVLDAVPGFEHDPWDGLGYYRIARASLDGVPVLVARTGYTGEDGFELSLPAASAPALWRALLAAGAPLGLVPAGLAARDTLRLEAGMPLHGHELGRETLPAQAGLGRVVAPGSSAPGADAARAEPADGDRRLVGLAGEGRRAPRAGYALYADETAADPVGEVTSGALSPTLGHPIAMAYVDAALTAPGTRLLVDVRGTRLPVAVAPLPFYRRKKD